MARKVADSRTARSARYGLLPPRARSSAAIAGAAASRASVRPSSVKRSIRRSAAPASCGCGQLVGRRKLSWVMCGKAGREASVGSSGYRGRLAAAFSGHAGDHVGGAGGRCRRRDGVAAVAGAGRPALACQPAGGCGERQWRAYPLDHRLRRAGVGRLSPRRRPAARSAHDECDGGRKGAGRRLFVPRAEVSLSRTR